MLTAVCCAGSGGGLSEHTRSELRARVEARNNAAGTTTPSGAHPSNINSFINNNNISLSGNNFNAMSTTSSAQQHQHHHSQHNIHTTLQQHHLQQQQQHHLQQQQQQQQQQHQQFQSYQAIDPLHSYQHSGILNIS